VHQFVNKENLDSIMMLHGTNVNKNKIITFPPIN